MAICCLLCHLLPGHQGELQLSGFFFWVFISAYFPLEYPPTKQAAPPQCKVRHDRREGIGTDAWRQTCRASLRWCALHTGASL